MLIVSVSFTHHKVLGFTSVIFGCQTCIHIIVLKYILFTARRTKNKGKRTEKAKGRERKGRKGSSKENTFIKTLQNGDRQVLKI
jgi:hypothetical protein